MSRTIIHAYVNIILDIIFPITYKVVPQTKRGSRTKACVLYGDSSFIS